LKVGQLVDSVEQETEYISSLGAASIELSIEGPPVGVTAQYRRIVSILKPDWMLILSMRALIKWDWLW
jgi:hypothetical protein